MPDVRPPTTPPEPEENSRPSLVRRVPAYVLMVVAVLLVANGLGNLTGGSPQELSYGAFLEQLADGSVTDAKYDNTTGRITGSLGDDTTFVTNAPTPPPDDDLALMTDNGVAFDTPSVNPILGLLPFFLPILLLIGFFLWLNSKGSQAAGSALSVGKSKARVHNPDNPQTKFDDVAGYAGVKQEITEIVDFLREPDKFTRVGARIPKGILLVGPPGTGKTLLARAVAGEAEVPFLSVTGSDFMEMFVGVGASRVRDLFSEARKLGKAIIFIDEIDSIGRKRGAGVGGGHDEREQTLNQMLAEMDGFEVSSGIVVMAATNRPDTLDPALLRPGRFDRQIVVPLPDLDDRRKILAVHTRGKHTASDVDLDTLARGTPGMSGADLSNLVNEAALYAVRGGDDVVNMGHFDLARDRVLIGQQRESLGLSDAEKEAVAYHEAGHAICAAVLPNADPVHKVTIIPSGMALGVTQQMPAAERHLYRQDYIEDSLVVRMGGRIAEELVYGVVSTGASDDLMGATELARKMVREWGMSERVGPMAWGSKGQVFLGEDLMHSRDYSDDTARVIDEEVESILRAAEDRCRQVLTTHRTALDNLAKALLDRETVDGAEVNRLVTEGLP